MQGQRNVKRLTDTHFWKGDRVLTKHLLFRAQWPRYLMKQEKLHPKKCFNHAHELHKLNTGDDRVQILLRLLELDHNKLITASELAL